MNTTQQTTTPATRANLIPGNIVVKKNDGFRYVIDGVRFNDTNVYFTGARITKTGKVLKRRPVEHCGTFDTLLVEITN